MAAAATENVLELRRVSRTFVTPDGQAFVAIRDVNLLVPDLPGRGEFRVFLGPSGSGKSTVLNIVAGLLKPTTGEALLRGKPIGGPGPDRGMVFQSYSSYPWLTVLENVAFGLKLRGMPLGEREQVARTWIKKVGLAGCERKFPGQLSGGMRQRVAIARTLAVKPQIILMDEPFGALDVQTRQIMENELLDLWQESRQTVLFITHDLEEAIALADRVVVISAGPAARVKGDYEVTLPRPRDVAEIRLVPEFIQLYKRIWADLRSEVQRHAS